MESWLSTQLPTAKISRYVRSHHSTLLAWVVDAGFAPLLFHVSLAEVSFLFCFQTFISFHQLIMFEDFKVETGWEIYLSIGTKRDKIWLAVALK